MFTKKTLVSFAVFFPIAFLIAILIGFALCLSFQEEVELNWIIVTAIAILLDSFVTWRNSRDWKHEKKAE